VSTLQKVWLIGADSFTGIHLIPTLEKENYHVDRTGVDITQQQQVEEAMLRIQPDYIISLAAISFVPDGEDESIYAVNTLGPQNILEACLKLEQAPKKIILASSANIYGIQAQEEMDESCTPNPINHYGCSKWAMEQIAATYLEQLNIIITRPFNYTGVGQDIKFLVPKIVDHFKQKKTILKLGNIDVWRDFSDVRWVSEVYTQLLGVLNPVVKPVNICSSTIISIREIILTLQKLANYTFEVESNPELTRNLDIKRQKGNNEKLFKLLPDLAPPIAIEETLQWMLETLPENEVKHDD